ncbi:MAG: ribose-5-phosphate isomerase RpiA [candidate division KSB1 bacterium]|nr:ribose-5-phosphate isomerase RpiA [candidate division KSB1 bacterium]MDZ7335712.1 ribose-5-phosphate isomerase RpiA [candidate division KSB1 bacterium]MDZ7401637.1 ribose-5-phosphate isomerase RpiA [candidate division KSB1 bacterium]
MINRDKYKKQAAQKAVQLIESGMIIGLGSGSTAWFVLAEIGRLLREGTLEGIVGVPSSKMTEQSAREFGIPLGSLNEFPELDLTIDGADEVDPQLNLIKGGGGALLREKILAEHCRRLIIAVDESKLSPILGMKHPVPVEVIPFGYQPVLNFLSTLAAEAKLRLDQTHQPVLTDQGNYIIDCKFAGLSEPEKLAAKLSSKAGIVEHGLFINLASDVIVAGKHGIQHLVAMHKNRNDQS